MLSRLLRTARHVRPQGAFSTTVRTRVTRKRAQSQAALSKSERDWKERVLPALQTFRQVKKHCIVDQRFVVPEEEPWPIETYGLRLGTIVHNIRSGQYAAHVRRDYDRLVEIEFAWNAFEARWKEMVMPSLEVFVEVYQRSRVPANFVVPSEHPWPEKAWNMNLGYVLRDIRSKGCYSDQVKADEERLSELGVLQYMYKTKDPAE
ncbi:TPA: hypothetical protein N0F65_010167 [Lagenidium giganteum]|uniref:Helicase-associated domain-containing protein n=1 Tax=Lagenidium giganteum TaxID=4803 RepID=A0AAV2Z7Z0_9STRA|nr:TPA: hypothetical protein N0F65_010167 [Lagenidium giganteum]